jgi:hypothetical protein
MTAPVFYDPIFVAKAAIEATKSVDGPTLAAWIAENSKKVTGVGGPVGATPAYHFLWDRDSLAVVARPDQLDVNTGTMPRFGC